MARHYDGQRGRFRIDMTSWHDIHINGQPRDSICRTTCFAGPENGTVRCPFVCLHWTPLLPPCLSRWTSPPSRVLR